MKKQAFNPYLPNYEYVPDGEPYVFGDRLYVYGSHDRFNGEYYCMNDYVCWSAPVDDLGDWRYEGVIFRKEQDPRCQPHNTLFAPDVVVGLDGRYYLYYTLDNTGTMSVAVGNSPVGPFAYYGRVHDRNGHVLGDGAEDVYQFDPGVLVDDDGRVWLYTGFGTMASPENKLKRYGHHVMDGGYCLELESDMLTAKTAPKLFIPKKANALGTEFEAHPFFEASSICKIGGLYYFVYSSSVYHELCYAVSKYPDRDFHFGGVLVSNGDVGLENWTDTFRANYTGNNHGGMVQVGQQWYIFYHRHTNYGDFSRQGCAEKLFFRPDGSIPQAELTSCGLNDGDLHGSGTYPAAIACHLYAKDGGCHSPNAGKDRENHPAFTQAEPDGSEQESQYITNLRNGSVAGFRYFDLRKTKAIAMQLRGAPCAVEVYDRIGGNLLSKLTFAGSESCMSCAGSILGGSAHSGLFFRFHTEGSVDFLNFTLTEA